MMPPVPTARLTLLLALIPAACQQTPEEERAYAAMRPSIEGVASERLGPVSRFMGMWEGTLEGVAELVAQVEAEYEQVKVALEAERDA